MGSGVAAVTAGESATIRCRLPSGGADDHVAFVALENGAFDFPMVVIREPRRAFRRSESSAFCSGIRR